MFRCYLCRDEIPLDDTPRATYDGRPICDTCAAPLTVAKGANPGTLLRFKPRPVH